MKLYYLKTCDSCRAARKALPDAQLTELRNDGVPRDVLEGWLEQVGPDVLINRRSKTWQGLSDSERAMEPVDLIRAHPTVMKRPVIDVGTRVFVGWTSKVRSELL